ncbi:hypothetical protein TNCV_726541 [Trichonephila clavipes]|nr:hypothetical protein TNCV_726541 [Trichonephila clavipes]
MDMFLKRRIIEMVESELSQIEVSNSECVSECDLKTGRGFRVWEMLLGLGPVQGQLRVTTVCQDQYLALTAWRQSKNIQLMQWPTHAPELDPVGHVLFMLEGQIAAHPYPPNSFSKTKKDYL